MNTLNYMTQCRLCPRKCGANRAAGQTGACGQTSELTVARVSLHFWEEPCISGVKGSGTVFFSGCALRCVYCQNYSASTLGNGGKISEKELAEIFLMLQDKGANNINLVTPSHFAVQIANALSEVKNKLNIPVIYNTGGYDLSDTLRMLSGLVDVYLPDFKYINPRTALKYSNAPDYPDIAKAAVAEMVRQRPKIVLDENGIIRKGVIVRNLLLPGSLANSREIMRYLFETYGDNIYLSIMNQYTPVITSDKYPELNMRPSDREYEKLIDFALSLGVKNAYIQQGGSASREFIPKFGKNTVLLDF